MSAPVLYLVVPCYNEQEVLSDTAEKLAHKLTQLIDVGKISERSRIAFVNDGSSDRTWEIIRAYTESSALFSGINLAHNEGHQNALLAGLMTVLPYADVTISMDADLQDDINAVDAMLEKYAAGVNIVYGVRENRSSDTFFKRFTAESFYRAMRALGADIVFNHADFRLMDMVQAVEDVRLRYNIPRSLLNIEVTEGAQSEDEKFLQGEIARFRAAGYEVWMDDFGSGYSSLNNLKDYVFDVLKIHMNFLRSFDTNPKAAIVIRAIVNTAKELGMHTLAEGVETEEQFAFLREIGCEKVQGYLFSPPMPFDKAVAYCHGETAQVRVEPLRLGGYYSEIGAINVLSNEAIERRGSPEIGDALSLAILEQEDGQIRYLYQSRMFKMFLQNIELDEDSAHTPHYERRKRQNERMIERMMDEADRTGREVYTDFITRSSFNSVRLRLVTRDVDDTRAVFLMATVNISRFSPEAGSMQEALNQIVALYDRVDLFDLGSRKVMQLYRDIYEVNYTQEYGHFEELVAHYAEEKILPAEQKLFKKFYSEKHLRSVLEDKEGSEEVAVLFYKVMPDGGRMLRLHHLVPFQLGERDYVISCVQAINEQIISAVTTALAEDSEE